MIPVWSLISDFYHFFFLLIFGGVFKQFFLTLHKYKSLHLCDLSLGLAKETGNLSFL